MRSIIITGANSGIGLECAMQMAKIAPNDQIILACRNMHTANAAIKKIKKRTNHQHLLFLPLDLASLQSVRDFKSAFSKLPFPVITALVNNAGGLYAGQTAYTKDGFEITFGTNHLGGFYLTLLLLPFVEKAGSITFTASTVHDPTTKTGVEPPVYTNGNKLAFPKETPEKALSVAQRRYSTSKLCNVLTTYILHEKLAAKNIRVNAFDPGMVPGTGFVRTLSAPIRFLHRYIMPVLVYIKKNTNSAKTSGTRLANLAYSKEFQNLNGIYFSEGKVTASSNDSYNKDYQNELWKSSIELVGIKQEETNIVL